ncbi:hypothetical protein F8M41_009650 [Gigaspora margarita]|uniref:Uncharacterized protein n=1 Tax=Gigaspora margarita TaxID=4874 RepID=A0A8H3X3C2_GIGMA|nr:hypothetical protein F8M41_009650 [Gigaspora margarita]
MNELSLPTNSAVKSKIVWRPLFSNFRCIQVPLTKVPSVIDLYTFDIVLSRGGSLSEGYTILSQDCTNNGRLREEDIKSITLIDTDAKYLSNSTLAYIEYLKCYAWAIQNALKYDKKLYYPSALEFEKVSSLMNTYDAEGVAISKQYGIKNTQDPKEQAVLFSIASTIMSTLLIKYSDLLAIGRTHGRIIATFISDRETIPVVNLIFKSEEFDERKVTILDAKKLQTAVGIMKLDTVRVITSYFRTHWFGDWHAAAELDDDNVQHAAAELNDDNDVQNAVAELDDNDVNKESLRLSES